MATVTGGLSYGMFMLAKVFLTIPYSPPSTILIPPRKRYIYPLIAPPTPPQLQQDKEAIDEEFAKAFALLDQLTTDTEALKASEQSRTERIDTALKEVENVLGELKEARTRREDEARRANDDLRGLKDLIQQSLNAQKESTENRLQDLNKELKGLKTLVGSRMSSNVASAARTAPEDQPQAGSSTDAVKDGGVSDAAASKPNPGTPSQAGSAGSSRGIGSPETQDTSTESTTSAATDSGKDVSRSTRSAIPVNRAAIPAWQLASASNDKDAGPRSGSPSLGAAGNS